MGFSALVLRETSGHHVAFSERARLWLADLADAHDITVDYFSDTKAIDAALLRRYSLFLQLDYPPYGWTETAAQAFQEYIEQGIGGWVGLHHASLLGAFDGYPLWDWFSEFLGEITYQNYIASFTQGRVQVEDVSHPVMRGLPASFLVEREEWYTYNRSPRSHVHVLASVDESSYTPDSLIKMGDHPVVWTNPGVPARNLYIFMGHSPALFDDPSYTTLLRNGILWAAGHSGAVGEEFPEVAGP